MPDEIYVTATDVWYYFICQREVWLMMHKIAPDEEDENIEIGLFIHEYTMKRGKKELEVDHMKMDRLRIIDGEYVVEEIKKSSKYMESSKYQLLYYLEQLRKMGIEAKGELVFPKERKRETIVWTEKESEKLNQVIKNIRSIAKEPVPPPPKKIHFCRQCAYREYCWAEG